MRDLRKLFAFVASLTFVLAPTAAAHADPIRIDQVSPISGGGGRGCCLGEDLAQTFTVGITGVLRQLALPLSQPLGFNEDFSGRLGIQLRPMLGGAPSDVVLAEMTLSKSDLPSAFTPGVRNEFTTFFSGLDIPVAAGEQLAIVLSNLGHNGQNIRWALNSSASYERGAPLRRPRENTGMTGEQGDVTGPWVSPPETFDFAFFTSVEATAATPEPGTVLLLGTGLVWIARRRRR